MAQHEEDSSNKENIVPIIADQDVVLPKTISDNKKVKTEPHGAEGWTRTPGARPVALGMRADSEWRNRGTDLDAGGTPDSSTLAFKNDREAGGTLDRAAGGTRSGDGVLSEDRAAGGTGREAGGTSIADDADVADCGGSPGEPRALQGSVCPGDSAHGAIADLGQAEDDFGEAAADGA